MKFLCMIESASGFKHTISFVDLHYEYDNIDELTYFCL